MNDQEAKTSRRRQQLLRNDRSTKKSSRKQQNRHHDRLSSRCSALPAPVSVELYNLFPFCSLKPSSSPSPSSLEIQQAASDEDDMTTVATSSSTSQATAASLRSKSSKFLYHRRPEHSSSLLHAIRLEIVIREQIVVASDASSAEENASSQETERVVLSRIDDTLTVHPTWHHLNEKGATNRSTTHSSYCCSHENSIDTDNNELYEATLDYRKYESMLFRFSVVVGDSKDDDDDDDSKMKIDASTTTKSPVFLHIPAHPSKLIRIWKVDGNNAIISGSQLLPPNLPINTVLVRYSDGSIRIQPSLYQLLLENNPEEDFLHHHHILKNDYSAGGSKASCSVSPNGSMDHQLLLGVMTPPRGAKQTTTTTTVTRTGGTASALDDFARFEDDVFRTLDTVASSVPASAVPSSSSSFCSSAEDEGGEESALASSSSSCASNAAQQLCSNIITIDNNDFSPSLEEFEKHQEHLLKEENDILEQMVLQERMALEEELQAANMEARHKSNDDNYRMAQQQLREQTCQVEAATHAEAKECQRLEFLVLAQQLRLLRELRSIYPIRRRSRVAPPLSRGAAQPSNSSASSDNDAFTIRGLPIPHPGVDLFAGTTMTTSYFAVGGSSSSEGGVPAIISEDDLSAALGYLCHVVFMLSKYLSIPLRYRLICNSSRSAVQEVDCHSDVAGGVSPVSSIPFSSGNNSGGGGATSGNKKPLLFPLFQARPIEREQVEHGVMLLERNVECLCKARGIRFDPHSHVLTKVNRIFECIVDGKP